MFLNTVALAPHTACIDRASGRRPAGSRLGGRWGEFRPSDDEPSMVVALAGERRLAVHPVPELLHIARERQKRLRHARSKRQGFSNLAVPKGRQRQHVVPADRVATVRGAALIASAASG